jgi:predicted Zn finger-like uncharacterized protein
MAEDELEPLITECPNCRTRFRVTENQLQVASGRVRCGACLTVFQGIDHLVLENAPEFASADEAKDALDALLDELDDKDANAPAAPRPLADLGALGRDPVGSAPVTAPADVAGLDEWTREERQLYVGHEDEPFADAEAVDAGHHDAEALDSGADADLAEIAASSPAAVPVEDVQGAADAVAAEDPPAPVAGDVDLAEAWEADPETAALLEGAQPEALEVLEVLEDAAPSGQATPEPEIEGALPAALLADLQPQPSDFSFAPEPRRWWIGGVTLLGVIALAAQIFFYQFESWGKDPTLRPAYAFACNHLGCELPVLKDLAALRTEQLLVRSHPDFQNALVVDAVIVNEAEFAQPFPILDLRFTTLQGEISAQRRFRPEEYLAGELEGETMMAPRTPVRLELAIDDPGGEAVNYFLGFR